ISPQRAQRNGRLVWRVILSSCLRAGTTSMSLKDKAVGLCKRLGAPAKFAAKLALGAMLPGSPAVVELVCGVLDCVHETAKDNLQFDPAKMRTASPADLQRVEQVLDILNDELA